MLPVSDQPTPAALDRLTHEYSFKDELDSAWAVQPFELVRDRGRTILVLEDPGGELLERASRHTDEGRRFLPIAVGVAVALGKVHQHGLIHKDIKPANILVNTTSGEVRLTGFGVASRLPRERQTPDPPEVIAGTFAYMAPEQTGRMNRSIDSRSDLYSLGVTLYEMLTGSCRSRQPIRWNGSTATSRESRCRPAIGSTRARPGLGHHHEAAGQDGRGALPDRGRCRSATCGAAWRNGSASGASTDFPLGENDAPDRLMVPEKLYGREREVETLLDAFDRIVKSGAPELVLVSGYSGIGKSSVVNEMHGAGPAARALCVGQVRPVQARYPLCDARPGVP